MKRRIFSVLFALVLAFSLVGFVAPAVPVAAQEEAPDACVFPFELGGKTEGNYTAEWSTAQVKSGSSSVHLATAGDVGTGNEARILIDFSDMPEGEVLTLGYIESISWWEYLVEGYPPHIDIYLDIDGDGTADDALVIEYAYNTESHAAEGWPTYGALVGAWYQTFSDDGNGPTVIGDSANAWLNSGPPGPLGGEDFIYGTLAEWKLGEVVGGEAIDGDTVVTALEIEVDNWIVQTEAYVDDIYIKGVGEDDPTLICGLIQDAIDSVGDTFIYVMPGTYNENIVIDKSLMLLGANYGIGGTEVRGAESIIDGDEELGPGVRITAADVTFQGFTVTNFTCDPYAPPEYPSGAGMGAIWATGDDVVISDNIIYNIRSTAAPEDLTNPDMWPAGIGIDVAASGVAVTDNLVHDVDSIGIRVRSDYEEAYPGTEKTGILVEDNTVYNTANTGVLVAGFVTAVTIKDNEIYNSLQPTPYSLWILASPDAEHAPSNVSVEGNTIYDGYGNVRVDGANGVTITGNTISGAIPHYSDPDVIKGKNIYIRDDCSNINITNNDITDAEGYGVWTSSAGATHINFNNISGNTEYGVYNGQNPDGMVDARWNWWDDVSGPEHDVSLENWPEIDFPANPGGTGDNVSDYVNYMPWLTRDFQTVIDDNISYFGMPMVMLNAGWNTFSTPIALDPGCVTWGDYKALGDGLAVADGTAYYFSGSEQAFGEVDDGYRLIPCDAIYVQMAEPDIAAILYSPDVSVSSKDLYAGWNLVSFARFPGGPEDRCRAAWRVLRTVEEVTGDLTGWEVVVNPPVNWHEGDWHNYWPSGMSEQDCLMFCMSFCGGQDGDCMDWCMDMCMYEEEGPPTRMCITLGYWVFMQNDGTLAGLSSTPVPLPLD